MNATPASTQAGFSLVETMVTVAIVGLMAAAVSMAMLGRPEPVRVEAERLYARFEAARESAILTGEVIGFAPDAAGSGYVFLRYRDGSWRDLPDHPALAPRDLPEGVHLFAGETGEAASGELAPLVWFDPTGFDQPFELQLQGASGEIRLVRSADGQLSIQTGGAAR